jgi:hypothetical protein
MSVHTEPTQAKVDRTTATLPQTTAAALFNVSGGRVTINQILGEVTVAIQNQANNAKLQFTPTGGTTIDLCTELDIAADEVGTLYSMTGNPSHAMRESSSPINPQELPVIVQIGAIKLSCSANNTGSVKWTIYYTALDSGAAIEAA